MSKEIGGVKNIIVKEGRVEEFEKYFFEMRKDIQANEPDALYYDLYKSRTNPRAYIVMERYKDKAAWEKHQNSSYGKIHFPKIRAILESISVEYFDAVDERN